MPLLSSELLKNKIDFYYENKYVKPSWFGLYKKLYLIKGTKKSIIKKLEHNGIETRPIISGNFETTNSKKIWFIIKSKISYKIQFIKKVFLLGFLQKKFQTII